jgi:hypothetical protein
MYLNAKFGENLSYQPSYEKWVDLFEGKYTSLVINFVDQNLNTIYFNDSNVMISLLIEQGTKEELKPYSNIPRKLLDINKLNYKDNVIE